MHSNLIRSEIWVIDPGNCLLYYFLFNMSLYIELHDDTNTHVSS